MPPLPRKVAAMKSHGAEGDERGQEHQYMLGPILVHEDQREGSGTNAERID